MKTKWWAFLSIILCTLLISSAQILWKTASNNSNDFISIINLPLILGLIFYAIGAVLMIIAFKGGELSVIHPFLSFSYVFVAILSPIFFMTDSMNPFKWIGIISISFGVISIGVGAKR